MRSRLPTLILLLLSVVRGVCDGGISIIRANDGKVIASDSPFGPYRDMLLAIDNAAGKVAVIQWGHYKSTIQILSVADGKCTKHTVAVGRLNGIDGAEYYDFASGDYVFHDARGLRIFGKNTKPREVPNPLPKDFRTGTIVSCKDGLLIEAGNCAGDYRGGIVYCYSQSDGSVNKLYETSEGIRVLASGGDCAVVAEDVKGDPTSRQMVRIGLGGQVLSRVKMPIPSPAYLSLIKIEKGTLYEAYGSDLFRIQQASLDKGTILRKLEFPDIPGGVRLFDVKDSIAVICGSQAASDGSSTATVVDIERRKVLRRFKCERSVSDLKLMKYKGEVCIVSN